VKLKKAYLAAAAAALTIAMMPAAAIAFKLKPCETKKKFDAMQIPPSQSIASIIGHEFRKADMCVPIEIRMKWDEHYKAGEHSFYDVKADEVYPGEFWYRVDREEFAIVANGMAFSGNDRMVSFSASGEACHHGEKGVCDSWTPFGADDVKPHVILGSKTGSFQYGYPTVVTADEEIPHGVAISPPHFEFFRSKDSYSRPPMVDIDNIALLDASPLDYKEITKAAAKRLPYSKSISWDRNENIEDAPTDHRGTLTMQISFSPVCPSQFRIVAPEEKKKLLFSTSNPGELIIEADAGDFVGLTPEQIEQIEWSAPDKAGSQISYEPSTRKGKKIKITYTGLPKSNNDFGPTAITAKLDTETCDALTANKEVLLFFPRDSRNNHLPDAPNYYSYWLQTPAGHGAVNGTDVRFMDLNAECGEDPRWLGYHPRDTRLSVPGDTDSQPLLVGRDHVYICDFHKYDNIYPGHPSTNFYMKGMINESLEFEGIDTFAVMLLHELTHRAHLRDWWNPTGGYPKKGFYDANNNKQRDPSEAMIDEDEDFIPDLREPLLGYDKTKNRSFNSPDPDMYDEHHLTYSTAEKWTKGSADSKDWAKPGKQWQ